MSGPVAEVVRGAMEGAPQALLRPWLASLGYRFAFRSVGFVECLIARERERFMGRGVDEASAFEDAISTLFPSHAARLLLEGQLASGRPPEPPRLTTVAVTPPTVIQAPASPAGTESMPHGRVTHEVRPTHERLERSEQTVVDLPSIRPESVPGRLKETLAYVGVPFESAKVEPSRDDPDRWARNLPALVTPDPEATVSEVTDLLALIDERRGQLALQAPERQRLQLLVWICHARSLQEASHRHPKVVNTVADVARNLGTLSKLWWPGSVGALQLDATPQDVGRELGVGPRDRATMTWTIAAEHAEQRLREVEARDERDGLDEDGWADMARLDPPPVGALERLLELRRQVEKLCGNIEDKPLPGLPEEHKRLAGETRDGAIRWVRMARWLRGQTTEFYVWGVVIGRLRWLAATSRDELLLSILDPKFTPARSWANELGEDPEAKRQQARRKEIIKRRPQLTDDPETVRLWVFEALGTLDPERVARFLGDAHKGPILAISPDSLEERRLRRQLKRLHLHIQYPDGVPPEALAAEPKLTEDGLPIVVDVEEADGDGLDRDRELLSRLQPFTAGKIALFVSNREDPDLRQRLVTSFGFRELEWCDGTPRRLQDHADRVAGGRYDLVLGATGFQSHNMDAVFSRACRKAKVAYVRVARGRQLACILALAREFGIANDGVSGVAI